MIEEMSKKCYSQVSCMFLHELSLPPRHAGDSSMLEENYNTKQFSLKDQDYVNP